MSLFVNTNVSSLNAQRQMFNSSLSLDTAFKRLSSGFRINSAADDAAGLQISNRLTTQINGNEMAIRNANDAISLAQVAEGAMEESTSAMQRMRTLAIQANNGINSQADREALNKELQALKTEMERIAQTTTFGSVNVLTAGFEGNFLIGANASQRDYFMITDLNAQTANLGQVELSSRPAPAPGAYTMLAGGLNLVGQPIVLNEVPFEQNYNRPEEFVAQVIAPSFRITKHR
jgi:flagellin